MDDCIFCQILMNLAPATVVYRDDTVTAFMDIQPINPGHLLVIPNKHATYLADLDAETAGRLMQVGHELAAAVRASGVRCEGINLFVADGEAAGQEVFHVHLHVIPRFSGDGFGLRFGPHYTERPPRADLEQAAEQIRRVLPNAAS